MRRVWLSLGGMMLAASLWAQSDSDAPRGPLIEVTGKDGKTITCTLLSMTGGRMDVLLASGQRDSAATSDVKTVRFLPTSATPASVVAPAVRVAPASPVAPVPPGPNASTSPIVPAAPNAPAAPIAPAVPATAPAAPIAPVTPAPAQPEHVADAPADIDKPGPNWTMEDSTRLRQLATRDRDGKITAAEEEELRALRIRSPLPRLFKRQTAEDNARLEASKGRLESYVSGLQSKLKDSRNEGDVKDVLMSLSFAYRQKKMSSTKIMEQLRVDMAGISNPKIREKSLERFNDMTDFMRFEPRNNK